MDKYDSIINVEEDEQMPVFEEDMNEDFRGDCKTGVACSTESFIVKFPSCQIAKSVNKNISVESEGRILKFKVRVNNVCRDRKISIAVIVSECNKVKAVKIKEVIGKTCECNACVDIIEDFCFIFQDENICSERCFNIKVLAQYVY